MAGLFWAVYKRDRFALHCVLAIGVIIVWHSFYRYKETRLVMAILPFIAVPAALAITRVKLDIIRIVPYGNAVLVLALVAILAYFQVRLDFQHQIVNGYPSFLQAMQQLREVSDPDVIVTGANMPQIAWYADRRVRDYPDEEDLSSLPKDAQWAVITNFEPGQKPYVMRLARGLTSADLQRGDVMVFRDKLFMTILARTRLLKKIAATDAAEG